MVTAFRIFQTVHKRGWNNGRGAFLYGGRWNHPGVRVLYASGSLALATLEMLVNLDDEEVLQRYSYAPIRFSGNIVLNVEDLTRLPPNWNASPAPEIIRDIGDEWVEKGRSVVLRVPTALAPGEFNFVVNLAHPDAGKIEFGDVQPFVVDSRIARRKPR